MGVPCQFRVIVLLSLTMLSHRMYRNQYDNDVTIWSPQGRIHQIEYAMEAVKQVNWLIEGTNSSTS